MTDSETMTANTTDGSDDNRRHAWITILAEYWRQTDWEQFQEQKARAETFDERTTVATRAGGVHEALDKLARGLNMASPELPTAQLDVLVADEDAAMRLLRREHVYLVNKANETVQNFFDALNGDESATDESTTTELSDFVTTEHQT